MNLDTGINLISLTELKEYLQVTGTEQDAILSTLLNSASAWVRRFVGRDLRQKVHTEYYNGNGDRSLVLRNSPIISVTSLHVDSARAWGSISAIDVDDNVIIQNGAGIIRLWNNYSYFYRGDANVKVVYTAGYSVGDSDTEANRGMPQEIRLAVKRLVDLHFRTGYTHHKLDVRSESVGDVNTTFSGGTLPPDVEQLLQPFRDHLGAPDFVYADETVTPAAGTAYMRFVSGTTFPDAATDVIFFHTGDQQYYVCKDGVNWSIMA